MKAAVQSKRPNGYWPIGSVADQEWDVKFTGMTFGEILSLRNALVLHAQRSPVGKDLLDHFDAACGGPLQVELDKEGVPR